MNLIRWHRPDLMGWTNGTRLSDLRDEIDRLFESPLAEVARASQLLSAWTPPLDLYEDKDNFVVTVELPGMKKDEIQINLHDGSLSVSGERRTDEKFDNSEVCRAERFIGRFQRSIPLPAPVDTDKVKAQYSDGVLTVTLPKTEEAKPRQINVQAS